MHCIRVYMSLLLSVQCNCTAGPILTYLKQYSSLQCHCRGLTVCCRHAQAANSHKQNKTKTTQNNLHSKTRSFNHKVFIIKQPLQLGMHMKREEKKYVSFKTVKMYTVQPPVSFSPPRICLLALTQS